MYKMFAATNGAWVYHILFVCASLLASKRWAKYCRRMMCTACFLKLLYSHGVLTAFRVAVQTAFTRNKNRCCYNNELKTAFEKFISLYLLTQQISDANGRILRSSYFGMTAMRINKSNSSSKHYRCCLIPQPATYSRISHTSFHADPAMKFASTYGMIEEQKHILSRGLLLFHRHASQTPERACLNMYSPFEIKRQIQFA